MARGNRISSRRLAYFKRHPRICLIPFAQGVASTEWLWKGSDRHAGCGNRCDCLLSARERCRFAIGLNFTMVGQRAELVDEVIENERPGLGGLRCLFLLPRPWRSSGSECEDRLASRRACTRLRRQDLALDQSVLSQRKDPDQYPEVTYLGSEYAKIKLFREWNLGRNTQSRRPQPADLPAEFLREDAANIALVLNDLEHRSNLRASLVEQLREADDSIVDFSTKVLGGTIQLFLHYSGLRAPVPATRLSDGTVRYLCLSGRLVSPRTAAVGLSGRTGIGPAS